MPMPQKSLLQKNHLASGIKSICKINSGGKKLSKIDIHEKFIISPSLEIVPVLVLIFILRNLHIAKAEKSANKILQSNWCVPGLPWSDQRLNS